MESQYSVRIATNCQPIITMMEAAGVKPVCVYGGLRPGKSGCCVYVVAPEDVPFLRGYVKKSGEVLMKDGLSLTTPTVSLREIASMAYQMLTETDRPPG